jgi:hypothetical protein
MPAIAQPDITVTPHMGYNEIVFANSDTPAANILKRTLPGVELVTLTKTLGNDGTYLDYTPEAGLSYGYIGSALDGSANESAPTAAATSIVSIDSCLIFQVTKGAATNKTGVMLELFNLEGSKRNYSRAANILSLAAGEKPAIKTSPIVGRYFEIPILIKNSDLAATIPDLEAFLNSDECFCVRLPDGDKMFCSVPQNEFEIDFNVDMVLRLVETAYSESVS